MLIDDDVPLSEKRIAEPSWGSVLLKTGKKFLPGGIKGAIGAAKGGVQATG